MSTKAANKPATRMGVQVIARAANILRSLEDEPEGLSLGDIAARVDLPRSTVQRIVTALADEQLLISASPKSRVKLGPALIRLANATNNEIDRMARPYMEALSREIGETIDLSVLQGKTAVFVDQVPGSHRLRTVSAIGERFPLHCTAHGKALMATLPDDKLTRRLSLELAKFTPSTKTNPIELKREIDAIRQGQCASDVEEYTEGISALSLTFLDPLGRAFAISIPVPTSRFKRNRETLEAALRKCQEQISQGLRNGYSA